MPMNAQVLGLAIANVVVSPDAPAEQKAQIQQMWTNVANEIISHISANATISVTVNAGIPVATAGSATAQTGATTGPGSGSAMIS